ncbi:hypothetical protein DFJ58DRAFT_653273, partial [Suillus subalutaceus]|uniref:uncharacterized protein n=1 Tax=Suillus subalutaceus TaxID=48586 RepID=UPI001B862834
GGGARYPYPKHVWSPAGGWWARPANWRSNTVVTFAGIFAIAYGVWTVSADREVRHIQPDRPIPSMMVRSSTSCAPSLADSFVVGKTVQGPISRELRQVAGSVYFHKPSRLVPFGYILHHIQGHAFGLLFDDKLYLQ